jgi:hypothetical protein
MSRLARLAGAALVLLASGCATLDSLSGSASMRIDVEVYKGPLAQDPWTQFGELAGAMNEAVTSFVRYRNSLEPLHREYRCQPGIQPTAPWVQRGQAGLEKGPEIPGGHNRSTTDPRWVRRYAPDETLNSRSACEYLDALLSDAASFDTTSEQLWKLYRQLAAHPVASGADPEALKLEVRQVLRSSVEVATRMRGKAYFWAGTQVVDAPQNRWIRAYMVTFSFLAAEYSNQIATRADALLQQMAGPDRRELPLSLLLRNANANDFVNQYVWNRAVAPALIENILSRPFRAFSSEETADRVRAYERLFGDYNWSNVNTVYASGQGDVGMAFIKDDIGNWNLKNFDNDPTELLQAYADLGKKAIAEAAKAVGRASGFGAGAEAAGQAVKGASQLMELANRVAYSRTSASRATIGGLDVAALHGRVREEIARLEGQAAAEQAALAARTASATTAISDLEGKAAAARKNAQTAREQKTGEEAALLTVAAEHERAAEQNRQRVFDLDQQILLLEAQIAQGVAASAPDQPTADKRLADLKGERAAQEARRKKNQDDAAAARTAAAGAAEIEANARKLDAVAAGHDEEAARLRAENEQRRARAASLVKVYATQARKILERHGGIVELLQEGIATAPPGAARDLSGPAAAPAAGDVLRSAPGALPR